MTEPLRPRSAQRASTTPSRVLEKAIEAAERINDEQPQSGHLEPSELQELAAELKAKVEGRDDAVKNLESAGRAALAALREDEQAARAGDADWGGRLLEPARQLRDGLDALLADDKLWKGLRAGETATAVLNLHSREVLYEVLNQNLDGLLEGMNVEPDQARRLAEGLRASLDDLLKAKPDEAMRATSTRTAQQHIAYVTHRLRRAIDAAAPPSTQAKAGPDSPPTPPELLRTRLRAAMWDGARVALPAAVAAGAVGLAFPGDHTAQAVGIAAGLAAKELLNKAVQYAASALLGRSPSVGGPATAAEQFQGAKMRVDTALSDCVARLSSLKESAEPLQERLAECVRIESISAVYGALHAQLDYAPSRHYEVRAVTDPMLESLKHAGNLIGTLDRSPAELAAVVESLQSQVQQLGQVLQMT